MIDDMDSRKRKWKTLDHVSILEIRDIDDNDKRWAEGADIELTMRPFGSR